MSMSGVPRLPIIERAYALAETGDYAGVVDICFKLHAEGYTEILLHFEGPTLRAAINQRCDSARGIELRSRSPAQKVRAMADASRQKAARKNARMRIALQGSPARSRSVVGKRPRQA